MIPSLESCTQSKKYFAESFKFCDPWLQKLLIFTQKSFGRVVIFAIFRPLKKFMKIKTSLKISTI